MCDPIAITSAIISIGGATASAAGQRKAADAQEAYQHQLAMDQAQYRAKVAEAANKAYIDQSYQANLRLQQEAVGDSQKAQQVNQEAARARASARVSAGEAGVSGLSIDSLLNDYYRQQSYALQDIATNAEFRGKQTNEELRGLRSEAQSKASGIRDYIPAPVARPSMIGTLFDIAGAGVSGFGTGTQISNARQQSKALRGAQPTKPKPAPKPKK